MFAISDDDFSRLVIAQLFAESPSLDPSGTSWLPLPFWLYGTAFTFFGNSLRVAHLVAVAIGLLSVLGLYLAARWVGLAKPAALLALVIGALFPHAANYRMATVPDYPTAVLALLAATSLGCREPRRRFLGALFALAATLSRYETWPLAGVVTLFAVVDWHRERTNRWLLGTVVTAPAGIIAWLMHGVVHHHDAFFFIKRVTAYRRALGGPEQSLLSRLLAAPLSLLREEPELIVAVLGLGVATVLVVGRQAFQGGVWKRPTAALLSVLAFLVAGELRDGTPTHHGERVLLSLWLGVVLLIAAFASTLIGHYCNRPHLANVPSSMMNLAVKRHVLHVLSAATLVLSLGLLVVGTTLFVRPAVVTVEPFAERARELALGQRLRERLPRGEPVAVYTEDYGYFAVAAALGRPGTLKPLLTRDPRHPETDPLATPAVLQSRLEALRSHYFVVPAAHRPEAEAIAKRVDRIAGFELYKRN